MKSVFNFFKNGNNKGLRYKLMLAFSLMSIIPLLAFMYLVSIYIFPTAKSLIDISVIISIAIVVALLGLIFAKGLINPVIDMAIEAKIIANGEYDRKVMINSDDEVGNLGISINAMTQKIKVNLDELKGYGQKMKEINVDVHKKVLALSSLLQIGDIISGGSMNIDTLLEMAVEKAAMVFDNGFGVLYVARDEGGDFFAKTSYNVDKENLESLIIKHDGRNFLNRVLHERVIVVFDKSVKRTKEIDDFISSSNLKNALAVPIFSGRRDMGLLLIGTRGEDFKFKTDDIDLIKVFSKQITIAMESDSLSKKNEELEIKDELTNLYNKNYIEARLEDEIKRAIFYQRPCSFVLFNIDNFKNFREVQGELAAEDLVKKVAKVLKENSTPVGKAARMAGDEFALLLPEKNKREALILAEDIRKKVESLNLSKENKLSVTISAGLGENPIDGSTNDEISKKAAENLRQAKALGRNKVCA